MALTWDFVREIDPAATQGITTSYFDTMCQQIYVDSGLIKTRIGRVDYGQWQDVVFEDELEISDSGYGTLAFEHPYNGLLGGTAQHNSDVVLLLYEYMLDVSPWLQAGTWQHQADNPVKVGSVSLKNGDSARFADEGFSLFVPGNRLLLRYRSGDSAPYDIGQMYIESSPYDETAEAFTFNGRNLLGFALANQSFDDRVTYSGTLTEIFTQMLLDAGILPSQIRVQSTENTGEFTFRPSDKYLKGITDALAIADWYMDDLPDGTIILGDAEYMRSNVASTGIHSFHRGSDVISRRVERRIDGVYSRVAVRRNGPNPLTIYGEVPYYDGWHVASHRTYYQDVGDEVEQTVMEQILQQLIDGLQYSGVVETFEAMFSPWLQIGDVASATGGDAPRLVGIMTGIRHSFGESGFFTQFIAASGGTISNPDNPVTVASKFVGQMGGANRQRRIMDYIQAGSQSAARSGPVGAVAYQAAVAGGYIGDEQTFNANLGAIASGAILPAGGLPGDKLVKASADDFDSIWTDDIWGGM